jgi:hypothetical protein
MNLRVKQFSQCNLLYLSHVAEMAFRSQMCFSIELSSVAPNATYDINNYGLSVRTSRSIF